MTTQDIIQIVADVHGLEPKDIYTSSGRQLKKVRARNHAMYLVRKHKGYVQDEIANIFGYKGASRSTGARHGILTHEQEIFNNQYVRDCHELATKMVEDFKYKRERMAVNPCSYLIKVA
jgi:hypothetical protein